MNNEHEYTDPIDRAYYVMGQKLGEVAIPIIGKESLPAFHRWLEQSDRRLQMALVEPAEAAHAFLQLRYERWR